MSLVLATRSGDRALSAQRAVVGAYAVGCVLAAAAMGATIGLLGAGLAVLVGQVTTMGFAGVLGAVALLNQLRGRIAPLPERNAQVPRQWLNWKHLSWTAAGWGAVLGAGAFTLLHHATMYVLAATVLLAQSPVAGALVGAVYGAVRGAALLATLGARPEALVTCPSRARSHLRSKSIQLRVTLTAVGALSLSATMLGALA